MDKIKIIPGEIIHELNPTLNSRVMVAEILDITNRKRIDTFQFVTIWESYDKDIKLPNEKRKLKLRNKVQMRDKNDRLLSVTIKRKDGVAETTEQALRRLFAKDRRYELASVIEAVAAREDEPDD